MIPLPTTLINTANMASNASSSSSIPQKRKGVSDSERAILRKRHKEYPWATWSTGLDKRLGINLVRATSPYDYVDSLDKKKDKLALRAQKSSGGEWLELEAASFE